MARDPYEDEDFFGKPPESDADSKRLPRDPVKAVLACDQSAAAFASELERYLVGQPAACRTTALALRRHYIRIRNCIRPGSNLAKENLLLLGPTGCGKSRLVRLLPRLLPLPHIYVDATTLTEAGWAGASSDELLAGLANTPPSSAPLVRFAILAVDEIDKKRRQLSGTSRDISGAQAQAAILSWLDSGEVTYQRLGPGRREYGTLNARGWLVICSGAFSGIEDVVRRRLRGTRTIGLDRVYAMEPDRVKALGGFLQQVNHEDLVAYGLIEELVGRLHTIVPILPLSTESLISILVDTPDSPLASAQEWAAREGFAFDFTPPLLQGIAEEAARSGLGARALFGLVAKVTRGALYEIPANRRYRHGGPVVHLGPDALRDGSYRVSFRRKRLPTNTGDWEDEPTANTDAPDGRAASPGAVSLTNEASGSGRVRHSGSEL